MYQKQNLLNCFLVHCNLVKNDYQHSSKFLFSFVPNKQFGQLTDTSPNTLTMMNTVNTEFSFIEVWFTNQASKALKIEDNVNLTLIIGWLFTDQASKVLEIEDNVDLTLIIGQSL